MAKEPTKNELKQEVASLRVRLKLMTEANQELAASIKDLIAELEQQTSDKAQLIFHLDELGYEVLLNGVKVHVDTEN